MVFGKHLVFFITIFVLVLVNSFLSSNIHKKTAVVKGVKDEKVISKDIQAVEIDANDKDVDVETDTDTDEDDWDKEDKAEFYLKDNGDIDEEHEDIETDDNNIVSMSFSDLIYPGSTVVYSTTDRLELETTDGIDAVGSWYKDKFSGSSALSYVKNSVNGRETLVISVDWQGENISLEVYKNSQSGKTNMLLRRQ